MKTNHLEDEIRSYINLESLSIITNQTNSTVHIGYSDNPGDMEFWAKSSLYPIITITNYRYNQ